MALTLPKNSLFSILMRSRWWVSLLAAAAAALLVRLFLPLGYAVFGALPFFIISMVVLTRELKRPSAKKVAAMLERARTLPAEEKRAARAGPAWPVPITIASKVLGMLCLHRAVCHYERG